MDNRRTILIFTDWYKPGFKAGGPVQSVYNLATLLSQWMNVKVVCRNTDLNTDVPYEQIQPNRWLTIAENHQVLYLDKSKQSYSYIKQLIKENSNNIIYINGLFSWYFSFLPTVLCTLYANSSVYISVRGMLHKSALSVKPLKKQIFLAFARGFGLYKRPVLIASNEEEREEIFRSVGKVKVMVAPNIPTPVEAVSNLKTFRDAQGRLRILCIGRIAPEKNPLALLKALQKIDFPVKVDFCGGYKDQSYFDEFLSLLKAMPNGIEASYLGELPNSELFKLLKHTDVMAMPSLGENFGHAIYESLARAVPVIIGNNTPWKDLESSHAGVEIDPMDTDAIAAALIKFNGMNEQTYSVWRNAAAERALSYIEKHDFKAVYGKLFI